MGKVKHLFRFLKKKILGRPVFDGRVRAYLTLKCNLKCEFCVNTHVDGGRNLNAYPLLPPGDWINIFHSLKRDIVITGGEPLLYPDLNKIITGVNPGFDITIYSNMMVPLKGDLAWLKRKKLFFYVSYHPSYGSDSVFLTNIDTLNIHKVPYRIHAINVMGKEKLHQLCVERLGGQLPPITIDEDQRSLFESSSKKFKKKVNCRRSIILLAPDGTRYQCVSRMVRRVAPFENLANEPFSGVCRSVECADYGYCAPCDGLGEIKQTQIP